MGLMLPEQITAFPPPFLQSVIPAMADQFPAMVKAFPHYLP